VNRVELAAWLLLIALLATLPAYAAVSRRRDLDPDVAKRHASVLLGYWLRDWLIWVITPIERGLVRRRVSPDHLNYLGVALGLLAGVCFAVGALPVGAWLLALAGICDVLDGRVARTLGVASSRGEFLDSTLDRFAETLTFAGVAVYLSDTPWLAGVAMLALGGSMLVSYTRARGEALGVSCTGGLAQRAERLVLLALGAMLDPALTRGLDVPPGSVLGAAVILIAAGAIATAVYRTVRIAGALPATESFASSEGAPDPVTGRGNGTADPD